VRLYGCASRAESMSCNTAVKWHAHIFKWHSLGQRYRSPMGPGGAWPPNTFWCSSQPKICKSVNVSQDAFIQHFYDLPKFRFCPYFKLLHFRVSAYPIREFFFRMVHYILCPGTHCLKDSPTLGTCRRQGVRLCTTLCAAVASRHHRVHYRKTRRHPQNLKYMGRGDGVTVWVD